MNDSLPEPMRSWVEGRVASGEYANACDYVRDLIRHDQEAARDALDDETRAALLEGIEDMRVGRTKPAVEVLERLAAKYRGQ